MISASQSSTDFYRDLAESYDDMTRFEQRIEQVHSILTALQKKYKFKTALDAACGTGLHAILLQKMGIQTVGVDNSEHMLHMASKNAGKAGVNVRWMHSDLQILTKSLGQTFDAIFCVGNSLPHLTTEKKLGKVLQQWYRLLNPTGHVIIQILNYSKILKNKDRIINITRQNQKEYIRFYDFLNQKLRFNVLMIDWEKQPPSQLLKSTILFPYEKKSLERLLQKADFTMLEFYGSLSLAAFLDDQSPNLVIIGQKSPQK
jgi:ubiquinone/menaquinone biosynthesis C-methylase UbiE